MRRIVEQTADSFLILETSNLYNQIPHQLLVENELLIVLIKPKDLHFHFPHQPKYIGQRAQFQILTARLEETTLDPGQILPLLRVGILLQMHFHSRNPGVHDLEHLFLHLLLLYSLLFLIQLH